MDEKDWTMVPLFSPNSRFCACVQTRLFCLFFIDMENLPVLLDLVEKRCPKLCPVFFPNGLSENQILKRLEEKGKIPEEKEVCEICESEEGQMFPQVMMEYDLPSRKCSVSEVKVMTEKWNNA